MRKLKMQLLWAPAIGGLSQNELHHFHRGPHNKGHLSIIERNMFVAGLSQRWGLEFAVPRQSSRNTPFCQLGPVASILLNRYHCLRCPTPSSFTTPPAASG